jgi:ParB family chromosome partitioning protein
MTVPQKRRALGKGLDVLFAGRSATVATTNGDETPVASSLPEPRRAVLNVAIEDVHPNRSQPRKTFGSESLDELASSIRQHGLMQPILVRKRADGYEIIAGERRWRASQRAGLQAVDVIVKDLSDPESFAWALVENIQREDLNAIEQAMAFESIIEEQKLTQEQLAEMVGKDRSTVANSLRLLKLPIEVRRQVVAGGLSMGHARALLSLEAEEAMVRMSREVLKRGLSVRQVEKLVRLEKTRAKEAQAGAEDPYETLPGGGEAVKRETEALIRRLGTKVRIQLTQGRKGRIEIDFSSVDELNRLIALIKG